MKKLIIAVFLVFTATNVYALDTSVDTGTTQKSDKSKSLQEKKVKEKGTTTEVTIDLFTLYLPSLLQFEKTDKKFKECHVISKPLLLKDFNLTAEISPGVYDTIYASILKTAGESNSLINEFINDKNIRRYRDCLAMYGAVIAQAYSNLKADLDDIDTISKTDLTTLADISVHKISEFNDNIRELYSAIIEDTTECQFNGSVSNIVCGYSFIIISAKPTLTLNQIDIYGAKFYGYSGSFKISESSKKTKEAVLARKQAWEIAKSGKQTVSAGKLLPNIH